MWNAWIVAGTYLRIISGILAYVVGSIGAGLAYFISILKQQKEGRNSTHQAQKSPQLWKA